MVEGVFARAFRSGLRPVELGRRLVREMDDHRSVGVRGRTVVPNHFTDAPVSAEDHDQLRGDRARRSVRELADAAREHARDEGYTFLGPGRGRAGRATSDLRTGRLPDRRPDSRRARAGRAPARWCCPTGERVVLGEHVDHASAGCPSATSSLADPNVSRHHAEIRPSGEGFVRRRPRLHQRHPGQRRAASASSELRRRRRDHLRQHPDALRGATLARRSVGAPCPSSCSPSSSCACSPCSTCSSCGCCGRCGPRSAPPAAAEARAGGRGGAAANGGRRPGRPDGSAGAKGAPTELVVVEPADQRAAASRSATS